MKLVAADIGKPHAAILCPSFFRAEIVQNPSDRDRLPMRLRSVVIGWLQPALQRCVIDGYSIPFFARIGLKPMTDLICNDLICH